MVASRRRVDVQAVKMLVATTKKLHLLLLPLVVTFDMCVFGF